MGRTPATTMAMGWSTVAITVVGRMSEGGAPGRGDRACLGSRGEWEARGDMACQWKHPAKHPGSTQQPAVTCLLPAHLQGEQPQMPCHPASQPAPLAAQGMRSGAWTVQSKGTRTGLVGSHPRVGQGGSMGTGSRGKGGQAARHPCPCRPRPRARGRTRGKARMIAPHLSSSHQGTSSHRSCHSPSRPSLRGGRDRRSRMRHARHGPRDRGRWRA